ncbi:MAG: hypothetical protein ACRCX2_14970 [Paraclostridium sp.]
MKTTILATLLFGVVIWGFYDRVLFEERITTITMNYNEKLEQTNNEVIKSFNQINDRLTSIEDKLGTIK